MTENLGWSLGARKAILYSYSSKEMNSTNNHMNLEKDPKLQKEFSLIDTLIAAL